MTTNATDAPHTVPHALPGNAAARRALQGLDGTLPWHVELYKDLHAHPELSFQETRTAGIVAARLRELGFETIENLGVTGVVGVMRNGDGPTVLARADMDALPVTEQTHLPYASTVTAVDATGREVGVMHACGHDTHVASLLGAAQLFAEHRDAWRGTFIPLFQPAEEVAGGARSMVDAGLTTTVPKPDVALGQHVAPLPYDCVESRPGAAMSAADSIKVTVYGRGTHGSRPHGGIDPILLASTIVVRLNAIVSRELKPGHFGVVTVGSFQAGSKSNIIPDVAELRLNTRAYDEPTRRQLHRAIERIVRAECQASGSPKDPEFEYYDSFNLTVNSPDVYRTVSAAFTDFFGDKAGLMEPSTGSEDFADIPDAFGIPYLYWNFGGFDPETYRRAEADGTLATALPANHASTFAPVPEPTLRTGISAMTVAVMAYLGAAS